MSDELIVVDAISTGKKKVPSCMLCRLTNSRGQHRHDVMHEVADMELLVSRCFIKTRKE